MYKKQNTVLKNFHKPYFVRFLFSDKLSKSKCQDVMNQDIFWKLFKRNIFIFSICRWFLSEIMNVNFFDVFVI